MKTQFVEPTSLDEAVNLLVEHGDEAKVIAGGAAVVLLLAHRMITPSLLVSLGRLPGYDHIGQDTEGLHLGALTRLRAVETSALVRQFCPALAHAYRVIGNVRVRNQGTVGGNLVEADYASDPPAMLLALNARIRAAGPAGAREIQLSDFFTGFYATALDVAEIVTETVVPPLPASARAVYLKYAARSQEARPSVAIGAVADLDTDGRCRELRVAVGAATATPQRLGDVEARARGEKLTDQLVHVIADDYAASLDPLDDAIESAWYRREMIRVFVRRALEEVRDGDR